MSNITNNTTNSFSSVLAQYQRLQTQILTILQGMTDVVSGNSETVELEFKTSNGEVVNYTVPSFGYLDAQIKRLDDTIIKLIGLDGSDANVRMADGSFRKIYQSRLVASPEPIGTLTVPKNFEYSNNWFFESFLNPALYIPFDVSDYVLPDADKILVKRIIVNTNDEDEVIWFDENFKGRNDITYEELITGLINNNIQFFQDEEVKPLPLSVLRYDGTFDVYKYEDVEIDDENGKPIKRRKYFLNKLTYSDVLENVRDTVDLKVGDRVVSDESVYVIDVVDMSGGAIIVRRESGYDPIVVGTDVLRIYAGSFSSKNANVGIGYDERQVVFFKPVDPNFNIVSTDWSNGIGFYSNELTIETISGTKTLEQFYLSEVTDFGQQFLLTAKERPVPALYGEIPYAPVIEPSNFEVTRINEHKLDDDEVRNINKKAADKIRLNSEIRELDSTIDKKKNELSNTKFSSDTERRGVKNELDGLIREKTSKSNLYASIVQELAILGHDKPNTIDKPKFRVRGFFEIPEPRQSKKTGLQHVIQFQVEYRYVRLDGSATQSKQYEYTNSQGQIIRGAYSNWNVFKTDIRKKRFNVETGIYEWIDEDITNPDVNTINQIDIPISKGERVEIRIKSISEAGYPINPLTSDYSETISIDFPDELLTEDETSLAIQQAMDESNRVAFQQELDARGLDLHLSRSFTTGDKYFAHEAERIASGFFTSEGNIINLFEKIKGLQDEIGYLRAKVEQIKGVLKVSIIDESGNKTIVKNGDKVDIFAGYYKDYIDMMPVSERKGAIINKIYKILIENTEATPLELISRLPGGLGERLPCTVDTIGAESRFFSKDENDDNFGWVNEITMPPDKDYNSSRRYDLVPIVNNSIDVSETNTCSKISSAFHQSQQLPSQYIYVRHTDVGLKSDTGDLYFDSDGKYVESRLNNSYESNKRFFEPIEGTGDGVGYVWNYGYSPQGEPTGQGKLSDFCIHIDHPLLRDGNSTSLNDFQYPTIELTGFERDSIYGDIPTTNTNEVISAFKHSLGINNVSYHGSISDRNKNKLKTKKIQQLNYRNNWKEYGQNKWLQLINDKTDENYSSVGDVKYPVTITDYISQHKAYVLPDKCGFTDLDRYLIGKNTCGCYMYMSPSTIDQLLVDGTDHHARRFVQNGDNNGIAIPVMFQFRMTDYYGECSNGLGIIGGYDSSATTQVTEQTKNINLVYTKMLGFDIYVKDETPFSFDLQLTAKYQRESTAQKTDIVGSGISKSREQITLKKSQLKNIF